MVAPTMVVTADAGVVTDVPPADGCRETVTADGWMVPAGKLEPVRLIVVMPGWPAAGEAVGESVTAV